MRNLSEFRQGSWDVEQIDMSDILNKEITVMDVHWLTGENGEYASMLVTIDGEERFVNTGAKILCNLLHQAQENEALPIEARFVEKLSKSKRLYLTVG